MIRQQSKYHADFLKLNRINAFSKKTVSGSPVSGYCFNFLEGEKDD